MTYGECVTLFCHQFSVQFSLLMKPSTNCVTKFWSNQVSKPIFLRCFIFLTRSRVNSAYFYTDSTCFHFGYGVILNPLRTFYTITGHMIGSKEGVTY